jgi:streptogramin lyase
MVCSNRWRGGAASAALVASTVALWLLGGCESAGGQTGNCVVAEACCELAGVEGGAVDGQGAPGCVGEDLNEDGWGAAAVLDGSGLADENGILVLKPNTVTRVPVVWVTSTDEGMVAKYDSATGEELFRVPTWGYFPNRTAVAADGSVWISNRDSYHYVHVDPLGELACASERNRCYTRAVALDAEGNVWVGCHDTGEVIKISGTETEGTVVLDDPFSPEQETQEFPKCKELGSVMLPNTRPYGLVGDAEGFVWVGVLGSGPIARIDTKDDSFVEYDVGQDPQLVAAGGCWSMYGMALDLDRNPWFANIGCANVVKVDRDTGAVLGVFDGGPEGMLSPRAMGVDRQGHLWVAENGSYFVDQFRPDGTWVKRVDIQSCGESTYPGTLGTGSDIDGNMWTVLQNVGKVVKYSTDGTILGCYPDGEATPNLAGPYTYSDLTGSTLDLVTSKLGRWRGVVEQAQPLEWLLVTFRATIPAGSRVCVRVRSGASAAALAGADWTAPFCQEATPAAGVTIYRLKDGATKLVPDNPLLEVELQLSSSNPAVTPRVSNLSVAARP